MTLILVFWGITGCGGSMQSTAAIGTDASASSEEMASLKHRIEMLEDKEAVLSILSRYSLNIDLGKGDAFLALFTDDCVFATDVGGKLMYRRGKKELGEMVATRLSIGIEN